MKTESTIGFISMGLSILVHNNRFLHYQNKNLCQSKINMGSNGNIRIFKDIDYFFAKI